MFIDARFPLALSTGATVTLEHQTLIARMDSGFESRNSRWSAPLRGFKIRAARSLAQVEILRRFWNASGGAFRSFRYKDFTEFTSSIFLDDDALVPEAIAYDDQNIGTGDGSTVTFQLRKQDIVDHEDGGSPLIQTITNRLITKPVAGTVLIGVNGSQVLEADSPGWSVDLTTGIVTFTAPPGGGEVITAGFEFDCHVRFNNDLLVTSFVSSFEMQSGSIELTELR